MKKISNRIYILDDLRGIAILSVILYHYSLYNNGFVDTVYNLSNLVRDYFNIGSFAVSIFFLISGFVIAMSLNSIERKKSVKRFIVKRFFRLYPTYWVSILLIVLAAYLIKNENIYKLKDIILNFTMFQDIFKANNIDGVYWTLAIEIKFYILSALFYLFGLLKRIKAIYTIFLILSLTTLLLSYIDGNKGYYNLTLSYLLLMYLGTAFYYHYKKMLNREELNWMILFTIIYFIFNALFALPRGGGELFGYSFGTIVAIFIFIFSINLKKPLSKITTFYGDISYSLYLHHQVLGYFLIDILINLGFIATVAKFTTFIVATFLATMINRYIENPLNKLGHNLSKKIA